MTQPAFDSRPHLMTKYHYNEIDLLRGIACLMVVAFHYLHRGQLDSWLTSAPGPGVDAVARYGYLGVHLFFIISGFVIFMSAEGCTTRQFAASRVARLYPGFLVAAPLTALLAWATGSEFFKVGLSQLAINMTMAPHWFGVDFVDGAYWSIAVELHFYILVGFALATGWFSRAEWLVSAWLGLSAVNAVRPIYPLEFWLDVKWAPLFSAGICAYLIRAKGATPVRVALFAASYALAMHYGLRTLVGNESEPHSAGDSPWVVGGAITLFYGVFVVIAADLLRFPASKLSIWAGLMTYPVYLLHQNIGYMLIEALRHVAEPFWWRVVAVSVIVGVAAWLVVRYVEQPLGPRIRRALGRGQAPPRLRQGAN